jgi:hypothetical protein
MRTSSSFDRAACHLATLPSTHMTDLRAHRCADRIDRGRRLHASSKQKPRPSREIEGDAIVSDATRTASSFRF